MRRALLCLILLSACGHDKAAKAPAPPVEAGPRSLTVTSDIPLDVTVFGPDTARSTLVVITGGPGLSHHYALPLGTLASAELRVVFYDQRGVAKSGRPPAKPEHFTMALYVADLEAIRAALKADTIHVLGHSWGSMIAQHYAIAHGDRIASLVIMNGIPSNATALAAGLASSKARIEELQKQGIIPTELPTATRDGDCSELPPIYPAYNADPKRTPPAYFAQMSCHDVGGPTFATIGNSWDNRGALGALKVPALVITGDGDLFGVGWANDMAAALPGAKKVIVPKCGHMMWDECPEPVFAELRAFLVR